MNTFFSPHQQCKAHDCWCGEKKVLAMNTQQEPTLIKYMKFLNDEGVEKVRLEKGLMAISDILLGGCLEAFIPEKFLWDFTDWRRELVHEMIGVVN